MKNCMRAPGMPLTSFSLSILCSLALFTLHIARLHNVNVTTSEHRWRPSLCLSFCVLAGDTTYGKSMLCLSLTAATIDEIAELKQYDDLHIYGVSFKGIIWNQKREKPVGSLCGQRYSWTKLLRIGLLARAYALIFRNQNPAYAIKKRKGKLLSIGRAAQLATAYWLL